MAGWWQLDRLEGGWAGWLVGGPSLVRQHAKLTRHHLSAVVPKHKHASTSLMLILPLPNQPAACLLSIDVQPTLLFGSVAQALSAVGVAFGVGQAVFSASAKLCIRSLGSTEPISSIIFRCMRRRASWAGVGIDR